MSKGKSLAKMAKNKLNKMKRRTVEPIQVKRILPCRMSRKVGHHLPLLLLPVVAPTLLSDTVAPTRIVATTLKHHTTGAAST